MLCDYHYQIFNFESVISKVVVYPVVVFETQQIYYKFNEINGVHCMLAFLYSCLYENSVTLPYNQLPCARNLLKRKNVHKYIFF